MELQNRKIVILGAGHVGSHAGYSLIAQGLAEEIVYIDIDQRKAEAQALDLFDATNYLPSRAKVRAGTYADAKDAQLLIVAVGPLPDMSKGQTRMDTLHQTIPILKDVVESIRTSGFSGIIVNISNPADVVTHYIQTKLNWPSGRIFSTSTTLDSARLRRALSQATGVDQKSIVAYALGEHGESQMVPWSAVTIGGKPLAQLRQERPDTYGALDLKAIAAAGKAGGWRIMEGKNCTEFGIGVSIAEVVRAVFHDEDRILPVSVLLEGQYGQHDVYASVPARLNAVMPEGIVVQKCYDAQTPVKALTYVNYILSLEYENGAPFGAETSIRELLGREGLVVVKKSRKAKSGQVEVDIIPLIAKYTCEGRRDTIALDVVIRAQNPGLNPAYLAQAIERELPSLKPDFVRVRRTEIYDTEGNVFR